MVTVSGYVKPNGEIEVTCPFCKGRHSYRINMFGVYGCKKLLGAFKIRIG